MSYKSSLAFGLVFNPSRIILSGCCRIISATFVLLLCSCAINSFADQADGNAVARINDKEITREAYINTLEVLYGPDAVQHLVARELLRQEVNRRNIINKDEIMEQLMERVGRDVDALLREYARERGYRSLDEYAEIYQRSTGDSIEKMRERLVNRRVFVQEIHLLAEILLLDDGNIDLSEERLEREFEQEFGPRAVVRQIVLQTRIDTEEVMNQLKAGADFRILALEKSIDDVSADRGGLVWPPIPRSGALGEAAFKLRVGQTSDIIRTEYGFHILKLESNIPGRDVAFEDVRDVLRRQIIRDEVEERMPDLLFELRNQADVEEYSPAAIEPGR